MNRLEERQLESRIKLLDKETKTNLNLLERDMRKLENEIEMRQEVLRCSTNQEKLKNVTESLHKNNINVMTNTYYNQLNAQSLAAKKKKISVDDVIIHDFHDKPKVEHREKSANSKRTKPKLARKNLSANARLTNNPSRNSSAVSERKTNSAKADVSLEKMASLDLNLATQLSFDDLVISDESKNDRLDSIGKDFAEIETLAPIETPTKEKNVEDNIFKIETPNLLPKSPRSVTGKLIKKKKAKENFEKRKSARTVSPPQQKSLPPLTPSDLNQMQDKIKNRPLKSANQDRAISRAKEENKFMRQSTPHRVDNNRSPLSKEKSDVSTNSTKPEKKQKTEMVIAIKEIQINQNNFDKIKPAHSTAVKKTKLPKILV